MIKRVFASAALIGCAFVATAAAAQSDAADRCTVMSSTDAEAVKCLRNALEEAERRLEQANVSRRPASSALGTTSAPNKQPEVHDRSRSSDDDLATLGAEQVAAHNEHASGEDGKGRYRTTIVNFQERVPGRMRFLLENGQIWQQTAADAQRLRLPSGKPIAAELWSSWSGGYRMLLRDSRQLVRVQRVR